jgi:predicted phage terminase large subunit-like protein
VGYGGAAGGGKSAGLLMAGLQFVETPRYHGLLLRRTFADLSLPDALIPLSHEWLNGTAARWSNERHQWTFPSGATLTFGYCENERDVYRYQGPGFAFVGWDELTQFPEFPYRYLFSRLRRRRDLPVPLRVRSGFNPGGIGHEWVKQRFLAEVDADRMFIPAKLEDNPYLDRESYEESLNRLDPVTRAQLRHGDWNVRPEGNLFKRAWFDGLYLDDAPKLKRRVRYWDLAATEETGSNDPDYTAGVLMGLTHGGDFVVLDVQEFRATPADVQSRVVSSAHADGRGVEVHIEQEPGASGKTIIDHYRRTVLPGFAVYGVKTTGDKATRVKPFSAACENRLVRLLRGTWAGRFLDNLVSFGMPGAHDDVADAAAGAHAALTKDNEPWTQGDVAGAFDGEAQSLDSPPARMTQRERLLREVRGQDNNRPEEL